MKKILRLFLTNLIALAFVNEIFPGLEVNQRLYGLIIVAVSLTLIEKLVKPILKALLLPINLLTMGTLSWIINVINLALLVAFVPQVGIKSFHFQGFSAGGIIVQGFFVSQLLSLISATIILTISKKIIRKVMVVTVD